MAVIELAIFRKTGTAVQKIDLIGGEMVIRWQVFDSDGNFLGYAANRRQAEATA